MWETGTNLGAAILVQRTSVRDLVVAGGAARLAIIQAIFAEAYVNHGLAQDTVFFALAQILGLFALGAASFGRAGSGTHACNVARPHLGRK